MLDGDAFYAVYRVPTPPSLVDIALFLLALGGVVVAIWVFLKNRW